MLMDEDAKRVASRSLALVTGGLRQRIAEVARSRDMDALAQLVNTLERRAKLESVARCDEAGPGTASAEGQDRR
jgi:hypothetical protein